MVVWESYPDSPGSIYGQRYTVQAAPVPSFSPPGGIDLALLLFGIAVAGLRGRFHQRA